MARYRVARQTLVGDRVHEAGEEIEFDGVPSDNLEPLDGAAKRARVDAEEHFAAEREQRALAANPEAAALGAAVVRQMKGGETPKPPAAPVYKEDEHEATRGRSKA